MTPARIRPSELRTPFQLLTRGTSQAANGQEVVAWGISEQIVWGRLMAKRGMELAHSRGTVSVAHHTIRIRFRADVTAKQRLSFSGRTWDIVSVLDPDGRGVVMDCECIEVVP